MHINFKRESAMRNLYKLFVVAVLAVFCVGAWAQTPIAEDDFTDAAGALVPNTPWRFNETAGLNPPAYDGTTSLLMDMNGAWDQYIDLGYTGGAAGLFAKNVAFVAIFTAPADAAIAIGYTHQNGAWPDNGNRLIKLDNGDILISDDHISTASNVDTGQDYVAGTPQGVMWLLDTSGNLTVHYQNGGDKDPNAAGWFDITPASDPESILTFVYGPSVNNKWGVNAYGNANTQFQLDYIGLLELPTTGPTPTPTPEPTPEPTPDPNAPIAEDDFTNPAGPLVPNTPWRFNETAGLNPPAYDGTTSLLMDMNGAWDQYIDAQYTGGAAGLMSKDVALVAIFTAPADAAIAIGYTDVNGSWPDDNNRLIKLDNGDILISDDHISTASNVDTNQDYVAGTPQGVMWLLDSSGNLTVHYQNGGDKDPNATGWVDITPVAPSILAFVYGPTANDKWGVNAYGNASAQFQLDYIGLSGITPANAVTHWTLY
jgi:hypothetical protein